MSEVNNTDQNLNVTPSPDPVNRSPYSWIKGLLILLVIVAAFGYWFNQNRGPSDNVTLQEIDKLGPDEQRIELEKQLGEYQERASKLSPDANISDKYTVYIKLAELQNRLQRYGDAIASVDKIAEQRQDNSRIWSTYASSYLGLGDIPKAKENISKAIAISDDTAEYWVVYFQIYTDLPSAELDAKYAEVLKKTNNDLELVKGYARFLEKIGNKEKAIAYWETARNVNPDGAAEYEAEIARLRS